MKYKYLASCAAASRWRCASACSLSAADGKDIPKAPVVSAILPWYGRIPHKQAPKRRFFLAARDKTPQAHAPALFGGRAIAPFAPVARHPEGNAIPHGDWRVWELLHLPMNRRRKKNRVCEIFSNQLIQKHRALSPGCRVPRP